MVCHQLLRGSAQELLVVSFFQGVAELELVDKVVLDLLVSCSDCIGSSLVDFLVGAFVSITFGP